MSRAIITNLFFLAALALCAAAAAEKQYPVKLQRPAKVGDRCQMDKVGAVSYQMTTTTAGRRSAPQTRLYGVELKAVATILELDDKGSTIKMSFTVEKCVELNENHAQRQLLPQGSVFTAEFAHGKPLFKLTGGTLTDAQRQSLGIIIMPPPRNAPTSDDIYGADKPQPIGGSWPINADALLQRTRPYGMTAKREAVSGTVTLKGIERQDGRDCLRLESQQKIADYAVAPSADWDKFAQGLHITRNSWENTSTLFLPLSPTDAYRRDSSNDAYITRMEGERGGRKATAEYKRTRVVHTRSEPLDR
jgi:hypothetical protein